MSDYARAAAALAQLPAQDAGNPDALENIRGMVNGDPAARVAVRALAIADRRKTWGEGQAEAGRIVDRVLGFQPVEDWPEEPSLPGPPKPEPLPLDAFPPVLRGQIESIAGATQTPTDLAGVLALACVSAAGGMRAQVEVDRRGWREPVHIFAAVLLPPASRKSPVYSTMKAPLEAWEREQVEEIGPAHRRAKDRQEVAEAALQSTKATAAKGKVEAAEVEAARVELDQATAAVPILPRLMASDHSPEALVVLMAQQGGCIALLEPEADPIGIADGRYSDTPRLDELLRAWSAEPIRVDRIGRESVHVERPALTLGLAIQPSVLEGLQNARAFRGRGLMGRVLWAVPPHGLGTRRTGGDVPARDERAAGRYAAMLRYLLDANPPGTPTRTVQLTPDALETLYQYEAEVERELADGARLSGIRDWAGKVAGQAIRLAALVELAARAEDRRPLWNAPVPGWAMEAGVRLARAFTSHALVVLSEMGLDRKTADLRYVLRRARELAEGSTEKNLHDATRDRPGLQTMDDLRPVVEDLVRRGCLRLVEQPQEGPGRPCSPLVELHPALHGSTPNRPALNTPNTPNGGETGHKAGLAGASSGSDAETDSPPPDIFEAVTEVAE